jgi:hypothetical protein
VSHDVFDPVEEIANDLSPDWWLLVGGLMVHAHAQLAGIQHARPTDDVDLVVEVRAGSYAQAAAVLRRPGYVQHEFLDRHASFHRFSRGREHVDLMGPEMDDANLFVDQESFHSIGTSHRFRTWDRVPTTPQATASRN